MKESKNFTHGYSGYVNYRCRCLTCTDGYSAATRARRQRAREKRKAAEALGQVYVVEGIKHNANGYCNHSCRCGVCVAGWAAVRKAGGW